MTDILGKVVATSNQPSSVGSFNFWLKAGREADVEVGNIVTVRDGSDKVYGMVTELRVYTDAESAMIDYLSHEFGDPQATPPTLRQSLHLATAEVIGASSPRARPVSAGTVSLSTAGEIMEAYGMDHIDDPVLVGVIPNGRRTEYYAPALLSEEFIIGPEGAHVNFSGASGLATKTSAAVFLIRSILSRAEREGSKIAVVAFNVKERDLLYLERHSDEELDDLLGSCGSAEDRRMLDILRDYNVSLRFAADSLRYFAPGRAYDPDKPHSLRIQGVAPFYWSLRSVMNKETPIRLGDMLDPDDLDERAMGVLATIEDLLDGAWADEEHFQGLLNRLAADKKDWYGHSGHTVAKVKRLLQINTRDILRGLFSFDDAKERDLPLRDLKAGQCFVIDIQTLNDKGKRIVFFNVLSRLARMLEELKIERDQGEPVSLDAVIVFVDELNKFAPSARTFGHGLKDQIIEIAARGRSVGLILFGAEQFASDIDKEVYGNCSTHFVGRTEHVELSERPYRWISRDLAYVASNLPKGSLLCKHALFPRPLLIRFPRPLHTYQEQDINELLAAKEPKPTPKALPAEDGFAHFRSLLKGRSGESPVTYFRAAQLGPKLGIGQSTFTQWYKTWVGGKYSAGTEQEKKALALLLDYLSGRGGS
jgi:hypothetical protein